MSDDDSLIGQLIYSARLAKTLRAEVLLKHGLYAGQDNLLKSLDEEDGQTMGSLAMRLGVRPPTITKMVSRMSAQGLVDRKASRMDSRQSHVFISKDGRSLIKKIDQAWRKSEKAALGGLKRKQRKRLKRLVGQVRDNLVERTGKSNAEDR